MPKRGLKSPRRPNLKRRPALGQPAWNTVGAIAGADTAIQGALVGPFIELIWHKRLRWYETILLLANRLNTIYPGIRDVFHAVLIPRIVKPHLVDCVTYTMHTVFWFMKAVVFRNDGQAIRYLSSDADPAPRKQAWKIVRDQLRINDLQRVVELVQDFTASFDVFNTEIQHRTAIESKYAYALSIAQRLDPPCVSGNYRFESC